MDGTKFVNINMCYQRDDAKRDLNLKWKSNNFNQHDRIIVPVSVVVSQVTRCAQFERFA